MMQIDHANITSVARFSDDQLSEVHGLLAGGDPRRHVWVNLGVETASGRLLETASARAKMRPFPADEWPEVSREQVRRLARAGFIPMVSLLVGLPGETAHDVEETTDWVRGLRGERVVVFPLFLASVDERTRSFLLRAFKDDFHDDACQHRGDSPGV
jgi:radical SAM superfamily enzyme